MITDGIVFSYGILTKEYISKFGISRFVASLISSVLVGLTLGLAPIAYYLSVIFDHRIVSIIGSILSIIGFTIPYFYQELWFVVLNASILCGIGFGLIYLPSIAIVNVWFENLKPLAIGIAVSGSGLGTFIFSLLFEYLISNIGLKSTMLITGGILLLLIPCSIVYRPVLNLNIEHPQPKTFDNCVELMIKEKNLEENSTGKKYEINSISPVKSINFEISKAVVSKKSSMYELLKHPIVLLLLFSNILSGIGFNSPYVFTKERAILLGVPVNESKLLISTIGLGNCLGRIGFGYLATLKIVNRFHLYNISLVISGLILALTRWTDNFIFIVSYTAIYGIITGSFVTLTSVILLDIFGKHNAQKAFALSLVSQGIAAFIGPPIIALMYAKTHSFDLAFTLCGILMMISGVIKYLSFISKEFRQKNFHSFL